MTLDQKDTNLRKTIRDRHSRDARKIKKPGKGGKIQIDGSDHKKMGYIIPKT